MWRIIQKSARSPFAIQPYKYHHEALLTLCDDYHRWSPNQSQLSIAFKSVRLGPMMLDVVRTMVVSVKIAVEIPQARIRISSALAAC